ncbi:MAG: ATP-binding protein [Planctomycetaceae bacterium]|nr:ATP-binding protein [Planctomycetaceae bacterium]
MSNNRKLPIGIQDFEDLRTNDYLYVDKTIYVYQLKTDGKPYFLSRPRRFGKSLFLSTLKAYFLGKKELFDGLAIAELEKDWLEYPVFHLDFNKAAYQNDQVLSDVIDEILKQYEAEWKVTDIAAILSLRFDNLIQTAYKKTGRKVVVLIDEYDKPLVNTLDNAEVNQSMRDILKGFYGVLKSADAYLRFVFLTGVTKFSKVSVFSDLNHLMDISLNRKYAGICGISETELTRYFAPEIKKLSEQTNLSYDETFAKLKKHYNGYHFCENTEGVYNPFSLLNTFGAGNFRNYWYATGTPTFLVKMLKEGDFEIPDLENDVHISVADITNYKIGLNDPVPILYQTGYLTIKKYDTEFDEFILGFPNEEVKFSFLKELLPAYVPQYATNQHFSAVSFIKTLRAGNIDGFMDNLRAFYSSIPYDLMKKESKEERYYQFIFYLLVTLMGQFIQTEVRTASGRVDAVIKTADTIFVFELKMANHGTAEEALAQIDSKDYLVPLYHRRTKSCQSWCGI